MSLCVREEGFIVPTDRFCSGSVAALLEVQIVAIIINQAAGRQSGHGVAPRDEYALPNQILGHDPGQVGANS